MGNMEFCLKFLRTDTKKQKRIKFTLELIYLPFQGHFVCPFLLCKNTKHQLTQFI